LIRVAVLTVSDRSFRGEREDGTGPALAEAVRDLGGEVVSRVVVPDERDRIAAAIVTAAGLANLVLTAGGTGLGPRDVTPEATRDVIEREAPGFGEEMRRRSAEVIATAAVSRATAGTIGPALVLNLPGSPRGAVECLSFLREPVLHAIHLLASDATDCV
jgi:molybdenum cofactor synthesis domain-containing protein